ncbi:hypothetical protein HYZ70_03890 [Candidatus Curtissbacteria bacterium]|nr:hypothetical protein [Candidatus Curtissbacteria bacterium]
MKFSFSDHFLVQAKKRRISKNLAKKIYQEAEAKYFDTYTGHMVAVAKKKNAGKVKNLMLAYDIIGEEITAVTTYPVKDQEIENRVKRGRWIRKDNEES